MNWRPNDKEIKAIDKHTWGKKRTRLEEAQKLGSYSSQIAPVGITVFALFRKWMEENQLNEKCGERVLARTYVRKIQISCFSMLRTNRVALGTMFEERRFLHDDRSSRQHWPRRPTQVNVTPVPRGTSGYRFWRLSLARVLHTGGVFLPQAQGAQSVCFSRVLEQQAGIHRTTARGCA